MFPFGGTIVFLLITLLVVLQIRSATGLWRGAILAGIGTIVVVGIVWGRLEWSWRNEPPLPRDRTSLPPVTSESCVKCHEPHYDSWHRSYHRTMTRPATPEYVKGDFNDAVLTYAGIESHMFREGDQFFINTVDPASEDDLRIGKVSVADAGPKKRKTMSVDLVVGSHWIQQYFHSAPAGRFIRLPLAYDLVEKRWMHINGAFVGPNAPTFFSRVAFWNTGCLYCHNTRPVGNPFTVPGQPIPGYKTTVGELGISCEACHGACDRHVSTHQNPARRLAEIMSPAADPTVVNPARLSVKRADDICARCHGAPIARPAAWDRHTMADPYLAGDDLNQTWRTCWSSEEMDEHAATEGITRMPTRTKGGISGRFWGDGSPLTTALEYQGMALSACYQNGEGKLSCLTCHTMHGSDPNHQLKEGMRTSEACFQCHASYRERERLVAHTHHAADSSGSQCMNCHMPHQVYSLLTTHRSHRITNPRVRDSLGTGKPHACNLCHLDKSLGWTSDQLERWYGTKPEELSEEDRTVASSVLHLSRGDARSRSVIAGAFGSAAAQEASGRDWEGPLLTLALRHERYEAIRHLLHRALRSLYGPSAKDYNFQGSPEEQAAQISAIERLFEKEPRPNPQRYPDLPLTEEGRFEDIVKTWMETRSDPDVNINE